MLPIKKIEERVLAKPEALDNINDLVLYYEKKANELDAFYLEPKFDKALYLELSFRLDMNFKASLEAMMEIKSSTDAEKELASYIFGLAWDWGHSCGYREVVSYYEDLVQIIVLTQSTI